MLEIVNNRGWHAVFGSISIITGSLKSIFQVIISAISLLVIFPIILPIIFISVIPAYFLERKKAKMTAEIWKLNSELNREWNAKTQPVFDKDSLVELKNFSLVKIFLNKWQSLILKFHTQTNNLAKIGMQYEFVGVIIVTIAYGLAFGLILQKVYTGVFLAGSLVFAFSVISRFQSSMQYLFENFGKITEHKKILDTYMDLLEMEPLIISGERKITSNEFESIEFKNVSFAYPGQSGKLVTKNLSLRITKGMNLAIVGLNGAGKTTFLKLLIRVYDPIEGEILVNGINLKEYDLKYWKRCLGILLQEYNIYQEETIAENIMLGDSKKHDQGIVEKAAIDATADEFIQELPEKYNQRVGTEFRGGIELSKGQKQKLALARVLYRQAPIIILDEPTAAVDALSEDKIFQTLRKDYQEHTRIIISHKFSNVRTADVIILIEHGQIIEQGSHTTLMDLKGKYTELFALQADGYK